MKMLMVSFPKAAQMLDALERHGETELATWLRNALGRSGVVVGPKETPGVRPREATAKLWPVR